MEASKPLSLIEFGEEFDKLCQGRCKTFDPGILLSTLKIYYGQVYTFPAPVVRLAMQRLLDSPSEWFPTSGQLKVTCQAVERDAAMFRPRQPTPVTEPPCLEPPAEWREVKDQLRRAWFGARQTERTES